MTVPFSYDLIAGIYDDDMGRNVSGTDVDYYVARCAAADGLVLELGCGTGRITLPLVRAGHTVIGLDRSGEMLSQLEAKAQASLTSAERARLSLVRSGMEDYATSSRFSRILCPYSAFTYLVEPSDVRRTLDGVRGMLSDGALFLLDVFIPDPALDGLPPDHVFHDYRRELADGSILERTKTIERAEKSKVNIIRRTYSRFAAGGERIDTFTTVDRIRVYEPDELQAMLVDRGFEVTMLADFRAEPPTDTTRMAAFECRASS